MDKQNRKNYKALSFHVGRPERNGGYAADVAKNLYNYFLHAFWCYERQQLTNEERRKQAVKQTLPDFKELASHLQLAFVSCCCSNPGFCGGWAPCWIGIHSLVWLPKLQSFVIEASSGGQMCAHSLCKEAPRACLDQWNQVYLTWLQVSP